MSRTGLAADPAVQQHNGGPGHPERPERYLAVINALEAAGLLTSLTRLPTRSASDDELALVHTRDYLALVEREVSAGRSMLSTGDTNLNRESAFVARRAAGSVLSAVDAVCTGAVENAFCAVRPPGHHANSTHGMGFCLFNNVAVAARYAQTKYGIERVLIADWDVHHGNGTQDIFYADGSVLFFSTHQSPWYPGTGAASETGEGPGAGKTINCPFPAGAGRAEIFQVFEQQLLPVLNTFQPELTLISAGFDSRIGDPLGYFLLTDQDFSDLIYIMAESAAKFSGGRLVSVLEGGYHLAGLASAAVSHVRALLGDPG